ncbi:hypothetical protein [Tardiphaga robiniae]|uniref:hypothetical protein n=1 Tax=Tardiphaga robiniae TaxID=943830 RepID=UPI00111193FB|nr:hypothetical protein [Tardiphaga robiniae]
MINLETCAHGIREALDECHEHMSPMKAGELQIGKRATGGDWQDITAETIDRHKKMVTTYEGILRMLSAKLQGGI